MNRNRAQAPRRVCRSRSVGHSSQSGQLGCVELRASTAQSWRAKPSPVPTVASSHAQGSSRGRASPTCYTAGTCTRSCRFRPTPKRTTPAGRNRQAKAEVAPSPRSTAHSRRPPLYSSNPRAARSAQVVPRNTAPPAGVVAGNDPTGSRWLFPMGPEIFTKKMEMTFMGGGLTNTSFCMGSGSKGIPEERCYNRLVTPFNSLIK